MDPDTLTRTVTDNPLTAGLIGTAVAAVVGFCRPIARAAQAAFVRRLDQAWADEDGEDDHDERVRKAADRVRSSIRFPLPQHFVEKRMRRAVSDPPEPLEEVQPPL